MKKICFMLCCVALTSFVCSSCDLRSESHATPELAIGLFINKGDTLKVKPNKKGEWELDSIRVGDTLSVTLQASALSNNLISMQLKSGDAHTKILMPPIDSVYIFPERAQKSSMLKEKSDYESGSFIFNGRLSYLAMRFRYVAVNVSSDATLQASVESDAVLDFGGNTYSLKLKTPVKEK